MENKPNKITIRKIFTATILFSFILTGGIDALLHNKVTYSSIMGMDINRVYFYTFFLLTIGCWLLYNKFFAGIGFITLASFSSYFLEYLSLHNYFASLVIYVGLLLDIIIRRKFFWLIPFILLGIFQGIAFLNLQSIYYIVGIIEFLSLCIGSLFIVKKI